MIIDSLYAVLFVGVVFLPTWIALARSVPKPHLVALACFFLAFWPIALGYSLIATPEFGRRK